MICRIYRSLVYSYELQFGFYYDNANVTPSTGKKGYCRVDTYGAACHTCSPVVVIHLLPKVGSRWCYGCIMPSWLPAFAEFAYIRGGWCPETWKGFTIDAFKDLLPVILRHNGLVITTTQPRVMWFHSQYLPMGAHDLSQLSWCCTVCSVIRVANELGRADAIAQSFLSKSL
ncbi:hypothetical protein CDL12_06400 [Handroanthus impetiginosus]|uniref:Uncharacterized protein n=1 Tax=Handroanthus impetiginosus TaxID=429701 RepID=A0A2G9HTS2_9LAMI|nr:hypothetical protein CDL12_06400 [Handroanthus impetiginosus]